MYVQIWKFKVELFVQKQPELQVKNIKQKIDTQFLNFLSYEKK